MNEDPQGRDRGVETRVFQFRPKELDHMAKFNTDKSFRRYISGQSYKAPKVQRHEILSIELQPQDSNRLPARAVVKLARGHHDLVEFVLDNLGSDVEITEEDELVVLESPTQLLTLRRESLIRAPI